MERLNSCEIEPGDSLTVTFAADWYTTTSQPNAPNAMITPVYVDGDRKLMRQHEASRLVWLLLRNDLLQLGQQVRITRGDEDTGKYTVTWLDGGEKRTARTILGEINTD